MKDFVIKNGSLIVNDGVKSFKFDFRSNIRLAKRRKVKAIEFPSTLQELDARINREIFPNLEAIDLSRCSKMEEIPKNCFRVSEENDMEPAKELKIKLPSSLKTLGESAFENTFLGAVTVKSKSVNVKSLCFSDCDVSRISFEATEGGIVLESMSLAHSNCGLVWIKAPEIVLSESCFEDSGLEFVIFDGKLEVLPESVFNGCIELCLVVLPDTLREIGANAFKNCKNLETVTLPDDIVSVDETAFKELDAEFRIWYLSRSWTADEFVKLLKERNALLSQGDTRTLREFFESNSSSREIIEHKYKVQDNCLIINEGATTFESIFTKNFDFPIDSIDSLVLPETLRELNAEFKVLRNLKYVVVPENSRLEVIGYGCFEHCHGIEEFDFPETLKVIGESAFQSTKLKKIELTRDTLELGSACFCHCVNLESVILKCSELLVGSYCFNLCRNLREVVLDCAINVTDQQCLDFGFDFDFDNVFADNKSTIPQGIFKDCSTLTHLELPETVEVIETNAFKGCEMLESIKLPKSLRLLEDGVFTNCKNLKHLELPQDLEKIFDMKFLEGTPDDLVVKYSGVLWDKKEFVSLVDSYTASALNSKSYASIRNNSLDDIFNINKLNKCTELKFNQYVRLRYPEEFAVIDGANETDYEETSLF